MESDVVFDSEFNLSELTRMVDSNQSYVSWILNKIYDKPFKVVLMRYV